MLPTAQDCMRRCAASQYTDTITEAGYNVNPSRPKVYSILGTAVHASVFYMLREKINTGELGNLQKSQEFGISEFEKDFKKSDDIEYDEVTPNYDIGIKHIRNFAKHYARDVAPKLVFPEDAKPERYLEVELKWVYVDSATRQEWEVTGHPDVITRNSIPDTKTGKQIRHYHSQLGGYGLLAMKNDYPKPEYLITAWLPRVHIQKPYPGTTFTRYPTDFSINEAWYLIKQIIRDVNNFTRSGDPASFQANPHSYLCGKKYCRAFGTKFCEYFK